MQNGFNVNKRQHEKLIRNKKKFKLNKEKKSRNTLRDAKKTTPKHTTTPFAKTEEMSPRHQRIYMNIFGQNEKMLI